MDIKIDSLIPYEKIRTEADNIFRIVDKNGKVVLLKDNQPAYIIIKYEASMGALENKIDQQANVYTLQEAMRVVLQTAENKTMHASALADEIFNRKLYLQKNGGKAQYNQIRARCGHYPNLFEALPGNIIKLKDDME